jgi:hypothetical protein
MSAELPIRITTPKQTVYVTSHLTKNLSSSQETSTPYSKRSMRYSLSFCGWKMAWPPNQELDGSIEISADEEAFSESRKERA